MAWARGAREAKSGDGPLTGPPAGAGGAQLLELSAAWSLVQPHTPQPLSPCRPRPDPHPGAKEAGKISCWKPPIAFTAERCGQGGFLSKKKLCSEEAF